MRNVLLGQISEINPQKKARINSGLQCSFIPMEYVDDQFGIVTKQAIRQIKEVDKGYTFFQNKDILFAKITPCMENGKCAIAENLINGIGFGSTEFHVIRAKIDVLPQWVYYYLRQASTRKMAEICMTGSAGQKRVPTSFLEKILIPLPSLPEQKRIAAILEKADRLRRLRRYALELSGTYLQTVFLEIFGDPMTNPKGWDLEELEKVCKDIYRYPTFYGFPYTASGTPVVRIGNILPHGYLNPNLNDYVFIDADMSKKFPRTILELHDIVMAVRGDGSTVSRIGLLSSQNLIGANMSPNLLLFRARKDIVDPLYLFLLMTSTSGQRLLESYVTRTAKKTITAEDIKQIKIPIPSHAIQEKFACIAQKFEQLQAQQREALRQAEHLFQTLLHKAFQGELSVDEDEVLMSDVEIANYRAPVLADVIEPINTEGAFQLALPME